MQIDEPNSSEENNERKELKKIEPTDFDKLKNIVKEELKEENRQIGELKRKYKKKRAKETRFKRRSVGNWIRTGVMTITIIGAIITGRDGKPLLDNEPEPEQPTVVIYQPNIVDTIQKTGVFVLVPPGYELDPAHMVRRIEPKDKRSR